VGRVSEIVAGLMARDTVLFSANRYRLTSIDIRGIEMAAELHGNFVRHKYLHNRTVKSSKALFWIVEPDLDVVRRYRSFTPQVFEPINVRLDPTGEFNRICRSFDYLLLNTHKTIDWLGPEPEGGWKSWVIPHRHCNFNRYWLPEDRLSKPKVVGYVGEPEHLHDSEQIKSAVEKLGLHFVSYPSRNLKAYEEFDIGVAWTRREALRDQTRSNVKMTNLVAHGIPSVVCDYESYRDVDRSLGGGSCLIRGELSEFIDGIAELVSNEELRRNCKRQSAAALDMYSRAAIAPQYWRLIEEMRADFEARRL